MLTQNQQSSAKVLAVPAGATDIIGKECLSHYMVFAVILVWRLQLGVTNTTGRSCPQT